MLCERCKKNEANVYISKIVNGSKQELKLCDKCAKEGEGINFGGDMEFDTPFSIQNLLSGIMDYIGQGQTPYSTQKLELTCNNCGTTYREFKQLGLLGCSQCYADFQNTLMPVIKRVQGDTEHVGKIPKKAGKDIIDRKKIIKLKEELQEAIVLEEYEKAAELRDKIRELQKDS